MAANPVVSYIQMESAFGRLLVAATGAGICWASLGDADDRLLADLLIVFPQALPGAGDPLASWGSALAGYLAGQTDAPLLPLDLHGTPFQQQVWQALGQIPRGQAITYTHLARMINRPDAVRAAAHACGCNRIAVLVPCHRVLRADGSLGGYRWGLDRKRALLAWEGGGGAPSDHE